MNKNKFYLFLLLIVIAMAGISYYKKIKSQESSMPSLPYEEDSTLITTVPYAFATASDAKTGAAFMSFENTSDQGEQLIAVRSDIAEFTEMHQNYIDSDDGMMMMRKVKTVDIPSNGAIGLEPKGYHIMFINLKKPFVMDETFPLTLVFKNTGEQLIHVNVVAPGTNPHNHP